MPPSARLAASGVAAVIALTALASIGPAGADGAHVDRLDPHHLPLGDNKVSAVPQRGFIMSCRNQLGRVSEIVWDGRRTPSITTS